MKVLITGGKGYIARNLVPLFEAGGYEVLAPARTELDLLNKKMSLEYFLREQPQILIHAACRGGKRLYFTEEFNYVYIENMQMWEIIQEIGLNEDIRLEKILILGSGAEFDRRLPIKEVFENLVKYQYPLDPYGLSKNLITRRAFDTFTHTYVLRLFGCFNWDEDTTRFIKSGILNLKRGLPITVNQNREFDFFYLDDIYTVMDHIIQVGNCARDMNLVYKEKRSLLDIASLIHKHTGIFDPIIKLVENGEGLPYTGSGYLLDRMNLNLIGLEEGIRRTVLKLT